MTARTSAAGVQQEKPAALSLVDVVGSYGGSAVVRNISLTVRPASVVALLGPNGAGKSTLLRIAAGLNRPKAGKVNVNGTDVTGKPSHVVSEAGVCLIPEGRGIFKSLTVRENLELFVPRWSDADGPEVGASRFPALGRRMDNVAGTLSGGEQQMLALSRAYVCKPKVVLVDEVSMGLAPIVVRQLFESIRELAEQGIALLIVEQYVNDALDLADYAYVISHGEHAFSGASSDLDREELMRAYLAHDI